MAHLFIAYSRKDRAIVDRLRDDLLNAGLNVWIDQVGLEPGTPDWDEALREAINHADAFILVASPNSRRSPYVRDEVALASAAKLSIYPLWVAGDNWLDCIPMGMGSTQYADLRGDAYSDGLRRVIGIFKGDQSASGIVSEPEAALITSLPEPRNPYKGLRAFWEDDQDDFFGRDTLVTELVAKVGDGGNAPRFHAVLGASGSGKSSVCMAGLLPKLRAGKAPGSDRWLYLDPFVLGEHPVENLTITLARLLKTRSQAAIRADLDHPGRRGLHALAREIADRPLILYIDQFEELFTLTSDEAERRQFIDLLTTAVTNPEGVLYALISMRADFYDRTAAYREFGALLESHHTLITPMGLADLYDVVQKPAALPDVGLAFDDGLVTEMVFAVREEAAALPLLQFTLDQLFEHREGNCLTSAAYKQIGGVKGALARHAEDTYRALNPEEQWLVRTLFLRLIEPGKTPQETTRRRARLPELGLSDVLHQGSLEKVLNAFVAARLLTINRVADEETVEVSHEALIREWARLGEWLHTAREDVLLLHRIAIDAAGWERVNRRPDDLYQGEKLDDAISLSRRLPLSSLEAEFINMAMAAKREREEKAAREEINASVQNLRQKRRAFTFALLGMLILTLGIYLGVLSLTMRGAYSESIDNLHAMLEETADQVMRNSRAQLLTQVGETATIAVFLPEMGLSTASRVAVQIWDLSDEPRLVASSSNMGNYTEPLDATTLNLDRTLYQQASAGNIGDIYTEVDLPFGNWKVMSRPLVIQDYPLLLQVAASRQTSLVFLFPVLVIMPLSLLLIVAIMGHMYFRGQIRTVKDKSLRSQR
jgi:hypothetical protein